MLMLMLMMMMLLLLQKLTLSYDCCLCAHSQLQNLEDTARVMLYCKDKPIGIVRLPLNVLVQRQTVAAWYPLLPIDLPSHHVSGDATGTSMLAAPSGAPGRVHSRGHETGSLPQILIDYHYAPNYSHQSDASNASASSQSGLRKQVSSGAYGTSPPIK
jgi:hypothetical protein